MASTDSKSKPKLGDKLRSIAYRGLNDAEVDTIWGEAVKIMTAAANQRKTLARIKYSAVGLDRSKELHFQLAKEAFIKRCAEENIGCTADGSDCDCGYNEVCDSSCANNCFVCTFGPIAI